MKLTDKWFTSISEAENGQMVFVTGRLGLDEFRLSYKLKVRVDIRWSYTPDSTGMPDAPTVELITEIEPLLRRAMERDKLAILTGNYTGGGEKNWVWYTRHLPTFGERLNEALAPFDTLPLQIECVEDPDWEEYLDMLTMQSGDEADDDVEGE